MALLNNSIANEITTCPTLWNNTIFTYLPNCSVMCVCVCVLCPSRDLWHSSHTGGLFTQATMFTWNNWFSQLIKADIGWRERIGAQNSLTINYREKTKCVLWNSSISPVLWLDLSQIFICADCMQINLWDWLLVYWRVEIIVWAVIFRCALMEISKSEGSSLWETKWYQFLPISSPQLCGQ